MRKIQLKVEALEVEGFFTGEAGARAGTVRAHSGGSECATAYGDFTCVGYGSCDPYMECLYTGLLPSCDAAPCG